MYGCNYPIPPNKTIEGYTGLKNVSCSYCSETCEAPAIDGNIGFFDGFKSSLVLTVYTILAVFTVFYQIYNCFIKKPRVAKDYEQILKSNDR